MAYVDTSVIISRYIPKDPMHEISERFFSKRDHQLYVTPLSLAELYSVFSRMLGAILLPKQAKIDSPITVNTLVNFAVKHCNLIVASLPYTVLVEIGGLTIRAPIEQAMSYSLAGTLKLRSLDLLHIALCWILKMQQRISMFITIDEEIDSKRDIIRQETGVKVKHLREILK